MKKEKTGKPLGRQRKPLGRRALNQREAEARVNQVNLYARLEELPPTEWRDMIRGVDTLFRVQYRDQWNGCLAEPDERFRVKEPARTDEDKLQREWIMTLDRTMVGAVTYGLAMAKIRFPNTPPTPALFRMLCQERARGLPSFEEACRVVRDEPWPWREWHPAIFHAWAEAGGPMLDLAEADHVSEFKREWLFAVDCIASGFVFEPPGPRLLKENDPKAYSKRQSAGQVVDILQQRTARKYR